MVPRTKSGELRLAEAKRLQDLRALLAVTQRELARHFGVAHGAIAFWESGKRTIPGPVLRLMDIYEENLGMIDRSVRGKGLKKLNSSWARVPKVFDEFCSKRVLTMQFMEGKRFSDFLSSATQ